VTCPCGKPAETRLELAEHIYADHGVGSIRATGLAGQIERGAELHGDDLALLTAARVTTPPPPPPVVPAREPVAPPTPTPEAPMKFAPKTCPDCKKTFTPTGGPQKRCADCGKKAKLQSDRDRHSGGGTRKASTKATKPSTPKPRPTVPRSRTGAIAEALTAIDGEIATLEGQLVGLKHAREALGRLVPA
jgi:hypothetical protein